MLLVVHALSVLSNPPGCTTSGKIMTCPLALGSTTYTLDGNTTTCLALVNSQGKSLQLNDVAGKSLSAVTDTFGEYCVYLDDFETAQKTPGKGEVGCSPKTAAESTFQLLGWDGTHTALAVAPQTILYFQGYVLQQAPSHGQLFPFQFAVTTYPQSSGVIAYRQPRTDTVIQCNGVPSETPSTPWPNNSGRNLTIVGATIYALMDNFPETACLYILPAGGGTPRWSDCSFNKRGKFMLPKPQIVLPGEAIFGQARHTCAAPGVWDWAAYIYTY
jgi:hypothetical protein